MAAEANKQGLLRFQCLQPLCIPLSQGPASQGGKSFPSRPTEGKQDLEHTETLEGTGLSPATCVHSSAFSLMFEAF